MSDGGVVLGVRRSPSTKRSSAASEAGSSWHPRGQGLCDVATDPDYRDALLGSDLNLADSTFVLLAPAAAAARFVARTSACATCTSCFGTSACASCRATFWVMPCRSASPEPRLTGRERLRRGRGRHVPRAALPAARADRGTRDCSRRAKAAGPTTCSSASDAACQENWACT